MLLDKMGNLVEIFKCRHGTRIMKKREPISLTTVAAFNVDIWTNIFKYLDTESKGNAAQVSKEWKEILDRKCVWKTTEITFDPAVHNDPVTSRSIATRGICRFRLCDVDISEFIGEVSNVEHLRLTNYCMKTCIHDLSYNMPTLRSLTIVECSNVTDDILKSIAQNLPYLKELSFSIDGDIDNDIFLLTRAVGCFLNLLEPNDYFLTDVSDTGISYITGSYSKDGVGMTSLRHLRIGQMSCLTNDTLKDIGLHLINIVSLDLTECVSFTDSGLEYLIPLKNLERLSLANCNNLTDACFQHISKLTSLQRLNIFGCYKITDVGLGLICKLPNLKYLNVGWCKEITQTGLENLIQRTALKELDCRNATSSTTNLGHLASDYLDLIEESSSEN